MDANSLCPNNENLHIVWYTSRFVIYVMYYERNKNPGILSLNIHIQTLKLVPKNICAEIGARHNANFIDGHSLRRSAVSACAGGGQHTQ